MIDYKYTGIAFPPQKAASGFFALATEEQLISGNIYALFRTRKGEMPGVPDFGNSLHDLLFEPMNQTTRSLISTAIMNDIKRWEPRVSIDSLKIVDFDNAYNIQMVLRVRASNETFTYEDTLDRKVA